MLFVFLGSLTFIPLSLKILNHPPVLDKLAKASGEPIALISNGEPIFSPLTFIMFPPRRISFPFVITGRSSPSPYDAKVMGFSFVPSRFE